MISNTKWTVTNITEGKAHGHKGCPLEKYWNIKPYVNHKIYKQCNSGENVHLMWITLEAQWSK